MESLTIRDAQKYQPWTVPYSDPLKVALQGMPHLLASHTVLHAAKTVGKLAAVYEDLDHSGQKPSPQQEQTVKDMAADLMAAALRLANLHEFQLDAELARRVEEKNGTTYGEAIANASV